MLWIAVYFCILNLIDFFLLSPTLLCMCIIQKLRINILETRQESVTHQSRMNSWPNNQASASEMHWLVECSFAQWLPMELRNGLLKEERFGGKFHFLKSHSLCSFVVEWSQWRPRRPNPQFTLPFFFEGAAVGSQTPTHWEWPTITVTHSTSLSLCVCVSQWSCSCHLTLFSPVIQSSGFLI